LTPDLFGDALVREQKRADRFDQQSALVLVSLNGDGGRPAGLSSAVAGALRATARDTDVIGWFSQGVLGLIVTETKPGSAVDCRTLSANVRRELEARLDRECAAKLLVDVRFQSGSDARRKESGFPPELAVRSRAQKARAILRDAAKRALDITGGLALLAATSPVLLIVAAMVKLTSPGPILYRQERIGQTGERFRMLKFRTMYVGADKATTHQDYVTQFIKANAAASGSGSDAVFKIVDDPRVTRVGHFLRKTSLDEVPQFWNVLVGEMSLVGPRPPLPYEVEQYKGWHHRRVLDAKPGITGLWQVVGRSRTTFDDMVRLDLRYARTRSLWMDLKILFATPRAVISGKGAC
jgi:lipopolysaccharide/colanic/teichoic acid biosynthesis glycosyltransferase